MLVSSRPSILPAPAPLAAPDASAQSGSCCLVWIARFPRGNLPAMTVTYNPRRRGEARGLEGPLGQSSATHKQEGFPNYIFSHG